MDDINTIITIPERMCSRVEIAKNVIYRYASVAREVAVVITESEYDGWFEARINTSHMNEVIYIKQIRSWQPCPSGAACLRMENVVDISEINIHTKFKWIQHPDQFDQLTPDQVASCWADCFSHAVEDVKASIPGLRAPQLAAVYALLSYFLGKEQQEPGTVVLPTGVGKTETMMSLMILAKLKKVMILVPTDELRKQISTKFYGLGCLPSIGVVPHGIKLPYVVRIEKGIHAVEDAVEILNNANVIVVTPNILKSSSPEAVDCLCSGINHLFIDEAHHVSAKTWSKVRDRFLNNNISQFTATPYRNDGSHLGGKIVYYYSVGLAQKNGYYKHINLIPVKEYYDSKTDKAIASVAVKQLRVDLENRLDHILMARVRSTLRADEVLDIYKAKASDLNPIVVHSKMKGKDKEFALKCLRDRNTRIIVCVDMLGEGFDLPNLKLAAIHDIHKSLAITLQFIGRFTRYSKKIGDASVIVNTADPQVNTQLEQLYAEGADWDSVLKQLSDNKIQDEISYQEFIERLKEAGTLHEQISLWNLKPKCSAILYKVECEQWLPEKFSEALSKGVQSWYAISPTERILVAFVVNRSNVKWGKYNDIQDTNHELLIAHWDEKRSALFVYASDYDWLPINKIVELIAGNKAELVTGESVFNLFNGMQLPLVRNLGTSQSGMISYTQYFGPNVTDGLSTIESAKSYVSNLVGMGFIDGDRKIWGCSRNKGKIWSATSARISEWLEWVRGAWDRISSTEIDESNITRRFMRPERIIRAHESHVLAVEWGDHILAELEEKVILGFGKDEVCLYDTELMLLGQNVEESSYSIVISSVNHHSVYKLTIRDDLPNGYKYELIEGISVTIKKGRKPAVPIEDYMKIDPWRIYYSDLSYSLNNYLISVKEGLGDFYKDRIEVYDWKGIDITKEAMGKKCLENTVQYRTFENIKSYYDVVFFDDGSGECADFVCLKVVDDVVHLSLYHCKASKDEKPGARIGDVYEVCGQALKSISWKHVGISKLYRHILKREEVWQLSGNSRFMKGSMADLVSIKNRAKTAFLKFHVTVVQPGISLKRITPDMLKVLGGTEEYLRKTTEAELNVIGSD